MPIFDSLNFEVGLDLGTFEAGLMGAAKTAKKAGKEIDKGFSGAAKSVDKTTSAVGDLATESERSAKSIKKTSTAVNKLEDASGEADSVLQALASTADLISPKLGGVLRAAGDTAGGFEAILRAGGPLIPVLGAVAAAGAVLGTVYLALNSSLDRANDRLERQRAELNSMVDLHRQVKEATLLTRVANDELSQSEADAILVSMRANDLFAERAQVLRDRLQENKSALNAHELALGGVSKEARAGDMSLHGVAHSASLVTAATEKAETRTVELTGAIEQDRRALERLGEIQAKYTAALSDTAGIKRFKTATEETNDAQREQAQNMAEIEAIFQRRAAAVQGLGDIERQAAASTLEGEALILHTRDQQLAQIGLLTEGVGDLQAAESARAAVSLAAEKEIAAEQEKAAAALKEEQLAAATSIASSVGQMVGAVGDFAGIAVDARVDAIGDAKEALLGLSEDATDAERAAALEQVKVTKAAALKAFKVQQGLSISEATISGAVAIVRALAELGPVAGAFAATAIAATTAAQIAVISTQDPGFALGGVVGQTPGTRVAAQTGDPRQRVVVAEDGEGFLTAQGVNAAGGAGGVAALNSGRGGGGPMVAQIVLDGRSINQLLTRGAQAGGSFSRVLRSGIPSGATNPYLAVA